MLITLMLFSQALSGEIVYDGGEVDCPDEDVASAQSRTTMAVGQSGVFYDDFNDTTKVALEGAAVVRNGNLTLDVPTLIEDDFERADLSPWTSKGGGAVIDSGTLHLGLDLQNNTTVSQSVTTKDLRLRVCTMFQTVASRGPWVSFVLDEGRFSIYYDGIDAKMRMVFIPTTGGEVDLRDYNMDFTMATSRWYWFEAKIHDDEMALRVNNGSFERWCDIARTGPINAIELGVSSGDECSYDDLLVSTLDNEGTATSVAIELPKSSLWDMANSSSLWVPYEEVGSLEFIDAHTSALIPLNWYSGGPLDIEGIDFDKHPSIKLRAHLWLEGFQTPSLRFWSVSWKPGGVLWMDSFEDPVDYTMTGNSTSPYGMSVFLNTSVWTDDFERYNVGPWAVQGTGGDGSASIENGVLVIRGPTTPGSSLILDRAVNVDGLRLEYKFIAEVMGPGGLTVAFVTASGKTISLEYDSESGRLLLYLWDGISRTELYRFRSLTTGTWYNRSQLHAFTDDDCGGGYDAGYAGLRYEPFGENFTRVRIVCGQGTTARFDDMEVTREGVEGTVVSSTIEPPEGHRYEKVRYRWDTYDGNLTIDVLDGKTGEPVPGYTRLVYDEDTPVLVSEIPLTGLDPVRHPSIRLRANMKLFHGSWIDWWQVWFTPTSDMWIEPFDDDVNVTPTGDVLVEDGALRTDNIIMQDAFWRFDLGDWTVQSGRAEIRQASLWLKGSTSMHSSVSHPLPSPAEVRFESSLECGREGKTPRMGPAMELICSDGNRLMYMVDPVSSEVSISLSENGITYTTIGSGYYPIHGGTYHLTTTYDGEDATFSVVSSYWGTNITVIAAATDLTGFVQLVLASGEVDSDWDDVIVSRHIMTGTGVTGPVAIPRGVEPVMLEIEACSPPGAGLVASLVDGDTGEAIPGWSSLDLGWTNITGIDIDSHPTIALSFEMTGVWSSVPLVDWCRILLTTSEDVVFQVRDVGDILMTEDVPAVDLMDLSKHFSAVRTDAKELDYEVIDPSDPACVSPRVDGHQLSIDLPTRDWYGEATFRIKVSTSTYTLETTPVLVRVTPVDDPPSLLDPGVIEVVEDIPLVYDISPYLVDVDTLIEDLVLVAESAECLVEGHILTFNYTEGGYSGPVPMSVSDGNSTADIILQVRVQSVNDPPFVAQGIEVTILEDQAYILDLSCSVWDEETPVDRLAISSEHPSVISIAGTMMTILSPTGPERFSVPFTVSDGLVSVEASIDVVVVAVNDPPYITGIGELVRPDRVEVEQGKESWLSIHVEDEDSIVFLYTIAPLRFFLEATPDGRLHVRTNTMPGDYTVILVVDDLSGGTDSLEFTLQVRKSNEPPDVPVVVSPSNHTTVRKGEVVRFEVTVTDPDMALGQRLTVTWTSDLAGHIQTLTSEEPLNFSIVDLPEGTHVITVRVSDGQFERSAWFVLTVLPVEEPDGSTPGDEDGWVWMLVVIVIVVAMAVLILLHRARAGGT